MSLNPFYISRGSNNTLFITGSVIWTLSKRLAIVYVIFLPCQSSKLSLYVILVMLLQ